MQYIMQPGGNTILNACNSLHHKLYNKDALFELSQAKLHFSAYSFFFSFFSVQVLFMH